VNPQTNLPRAATSCLAALLLSLVLGVLPGASVSSASPAPDDGAAAAVAARGDNPTRTSVAKFRKNWVFRSPRLNRCAFIEVTARMEGHWRWAYRNPDGSWNHNTKNWLGFDLKNPAVHVTGWPILGAGCNSTERWKIKANISQGWYQSGCDLDVSVAVGFPWSIEASPSYQCGTKRLGHTTSTEGPSRKTLHQYNTGVPLHFDGVLADRTSGVGFSGDVIVRIHTRNASDRFKGHMLVALK